MNKVERAKMVLAMEYIARKINNEKAFASWLLMGVTDGDLSDHSDCWFNDDGSFALSGFITGYFDWYTEDENFAAIMETFLYCMKKAREDGGLYCDGIVSGF